MTKKRLKVPDCSPADERRWCRERRDNVIAYLQREGVTHGRVGEWPAWHVAPYVSVWAIESVQRSGFVGWWVISGDMPTDYVSAADIKHPRQVLHAFGTSWRTEARLMARGRCGKVQIGSPSERRSLAPLLEARAAFLLQCASDDRLWEDE